MKLKQLLAFILAAMMLALLAPSAMARQAGALYKGDTDADFAPEKLVSEAQGLLRNLGYYTGSVDGDFGVNMEKAVIAFQVRNGLTSDGIVGKKTWAALRSGTAISATDPVVQALSQGSTGSRVKELQELLKTWYYLNYSGGADGIYGSDVTKAVRAFQASVGLVADGKAGDATWAALRNRTHAIFNGGAPIRTLREGMRGYDVYVLQQRLRDLGFLFVSVKNGYYCESVTAAVKAFQKANALNETGYVTHNTVLYLWPSSTSPVDKNVLKMGSTGKDVSAIQMRLKAAGYLLSNVDGVFGRKTRDAVLLVQRYYSLKQDGIVGKETRAVIETFPLDDADPGTGGVVYRPLRVGSSGATVKQMQERLIELGYLADGENDGVFGRVTLTAVLGFQRDHNLDQDGVAGSKTLGLLFNRTEP